MTSNNEAKTKTTTKRRKISQIFNAQEKTQAVLALWTEKCRGAQICQELGITWMTLNHWQNRAMEGMLQAMETRASLAEGKALSPRLQALLARRQNGLGEQKLQDRLNRIQEKGS